MAKTKVEFDSGEAMSVSMAIGEYKRILEAKKDGDHPSDTLVKAIRIRIICELGTAYDKLEEAIQERGKV